MKARLGRWTITFALACMPIVAAGCDDDIDADEIIDIIYAAGDVVAWILHMTL
jgi:hypothetical protein